MPFLVQDANDERSTAVLAHDDEVETVTLDEMLLVTEMRQCLAVTTGDVLHAFPVSVFGRTVDVIPHGSRSCDT